MLIPLQQWICDTCGQIINCPEDGYVIWNRDTTDGHDFRIIHQRECDDRDTPCSGDLSGFLGDSGRTRLLSWLSAGPLNLTPGEATQSWVINLDEFVDFFRRVQIPYYEEARTKFDTQEVQECFAGANEYRPYMPDALQRIVNGDLD